MSKELEGGEDPGTTSQPEDIITDTTSADAEDTGIDSQEDAQTSDEEDDFWAEAVGALSGDSDTDEDSDDAVEEPAEEELPEEEEQPDEGGDSDPDESVDWKKEAERYDKMQRDTKRAHTELSQSNAELRKELEAIKAKLSDPEEEIDEDDPATRGDVKEDFNKLYEERKAAEEAAQAKAAEAAKQAESDKAFYDGVREKVPEYDKIVNDPEFKDWHAQHKNWADSQIQSHDYDDPTGMVKVLERYQTNTATKKEAVRKKDTRLSRTMGPTGKGKPSSSPAAQGDDFADAVKATRKRVSKTSFTGFI